MRKQKINKKAFTLIELILVISILSILWIIAFISYNWYSSKARNSVRLLDIKSMSWTLELFSVETGDYPTPIWDTASIKKVWSVSLWTEWKFNQDILNQTWNLSKVPLDPKTKLEYDYSKAINQVEYELKYELEDKTSFAPVYAEDKLITKIFSKYNKIYVVWNDGKYYSSPSLFADWDLNPVDSVSKFYLDWEGQSKDFIITKLADKTPTKDDVTDNFSTFWQNIKLAYDKDVFREKKLYKAILDYPNEDNAELWELILWWTVSSGVTNSSTPVPSYSCTWSLVTANATITNTADLTADTPYQNTNSGAFCYYQCKNENYSGTNCETYSLITSSQCTWAGWIWVPDTSDVKIWTKTKTWFCISPRIWDFAWDSTWNGISWNGWWYETSNWNYQWWNSSASLDSETVDDDWNPYPQYWQTKNLTHVNDTPTPYTCSALWTLASWTWNVWWDTIAWRMKWLADENNKNNLTAMQNIPWVEGLTLKNGHPTPSLYIADCIDWIKDLWTDMTYIHNDNSTDEVTYAEYNTDVAANTDSADLTNTTYQNRQKYLTAWTQKSGSHLPSAFSYITNWKASANDSDWDFLENDDRWEYQMACELYQNDAWATNNDFYDAWASSSDDVDNERIWLSAVGYTSGSNWGRGARVVGYDGCSDQHNGYTGSRSGNRSARFVVRP